MPLSDLFNAIHTYYSMRIALWNHMAIEPLGYGGEEWAKMYLAWQQKLVKINVSGVTPVILCTRLKWPFSCRITILKLKGSSPAIPIEVVCPWNVVKW